jgi:hypothetical protein
MEKAMKKLLVMITALMALAFVGCEDESPVVYVDDPPQAPQGVFSITGDLEITIVWLGLYEEDVVEYVVGWNDELLGEYSEIGRVKAQPRPESNYYSYVDNDVDSGVTYFYAVWAVDAGGNVSEASYEIVFDTPRPEGTVDLYSRFVDPSRTGFEFATRAVGPFDGPMTDVFVDHDTLFFVDGSNVDTVLVLFLNSAYLDTDIQDMGFADSFDEIGWAPIEGWSDTRRYELIPGHIYVIWTQFERYAKMQVDAISPQTGWVRLKWAYQPAGPEDTLANRELMPRPPIEDADNTSSFDQGR